MFVSTGYFVSTYERVRARARNNIFERTCAHTGDRMLSSGGDGNGDNDVGGGGGESSRKK